MSGLLLDTHVLIWFLYTPKLLSEKLVGDISQADAVWVSTVSPWEMAIKHRTGKLAYDPIEALNNIERAGLNILDVTSKHIIEYRHIELPHSDPFDTMLVAQAESESLIFVTADTQILNSKYKTISARISK